MFEYYETLITPEDAADMLGCGMNSIYKLLNVGKIKAMRIGRHWKIPKGNIKAVQGDTGHAEARMVTDTYAHSFDEDRKLIAQEMDAGLFSRIGTEQLPAPHQTNAEELDAVRQFIKAHPELLSELLSEIHE